ncbi:MAG: hypothetical protein VCA36_04195 [Opitutales bacterium]
MNLALGPTLLCSAYQRVVEAGTEEWVERMGRGRALKVETTSSGEYRFSPGGLCFRDHLSFVEAVVHGFAWPRLGLLLAQPVESWQAIRTLRGVSDSMQGDFGPEVKVAIGLRSGLAAAEVYGREDPKCVEAMAREHPGCVAFSVADTEIAAWFRLEPDGFRSGRGEPPEGADAQVIFRDLEVALRAVETGLDPLIAPVTGEVMVAGRIPLAEAVGYVADRASRDLVLPK